MKKNLATYAIKMLALTLIAFAAMLKPAFCQEPAIDNDLIIYSLGVAPDQQVKFRLPKDIRSGDMITGTVVEVSNKLLPYSPADSFPYNNINSGKVANSSSSFQGMVIEIDGKQTKLSNCLISFIVPAGLTSLPFLLKNSAGKVIERGQIPIGISYSTAPTQLPLDQISLMPKFSPEAVGQPGQLLKISGSFDGNAANTNVSLNGQPCEIIAESPRIINVQVSENATAGVSNLAIQENNVIEEQKINIIRLDLSAPKTNLRRGEKTTIDVTVNGVEGITADKMNFKLRVENLSPQTISFLKENSNVIEREINAKAVKNGKYKFSTKIVALTAGVFTVSANITGPKKDSCQEAYEIEWASIIQQEQEAIKKCNETKGSGLDDCLLKVKTRIDALKSKCQENFINCRKNK